MFRADFTRYGRSITHDVECAVATCDRVLHLRDGRVAQDVPLRDAEELLAAMR